MTHDELAALRKRKSLAATHAGNASPAGAIAGRRRRPPEPSIDDEPGDIGVMILDLTQMEGMAEELLAEARAVGDEELTTAVETLGAVIVGCRRLARSKTGGSE